MTKRSYTSAVLVLAVVSNFVLLPLAIAIGKVGREHQTANRSHDPGGNRSGPPAMPKRLDRPLVADFRSHGVRFVPPRDAANPSGALDPPVTPEPARSGNETSSDRPVGPLAQAPQPPEARPPTFIELLGEGLSLLKAGDYEAALEKFEAAGGLQPSRQIDYLKGVTLNRLGRYRQALINLWRAAKRGVALPSLDFEIGRAAVAMGAWRLAADSLARFDQATPGDAQVSVLLGRAYLGLGDFDQAEARLREATERNRSARPAALYYLALLEQARDNPEAARHGLEELEKEAPGSDFVRRLEETLPQPESPWLLSTALTYGSNDNVLLNPEGQALAEDVSQTASDFWAYSASVGYEWRITPNDILSPGVFIQGSRYGSIRQADFMSPSGDLGYARRLPFGLEATAGIAYGDTRVDGDGFNETVTTRATLSYRPTDRLTLVAGYRFNGTDYDTEPAETAEDRDSLSHSASLTALVALPDVQTVKTRLRLGLSQTWNSADGADYDFESRAGTIALSFVLPWLSLAATVSRTESDYDNPNSRSVPSLAFRRDDNRTSYSVRLSRPFGAGFRLFAAYGRTRNNSNISPFGYTQNTWSGGVDWAF